MKPQNGNMRFGRGASGGFSLVEIAVAVGLFAFGVVGIIGLFPTALAQRADAARDTRAVVIAGSIFEALEGSGDMLRTNQKFFLPRLVEMGPDNYSAEGQLRMRITNDFPLSIGFGVAGTTPVRVIDGREAWDQGTAGKSDLKDTYFVALLTRDSTSVTNLYRVGVQIGFPATLPEKKRRNTVFTSLVYMP
jgi:hypothetical protein